MSASMSYYHKPRTNPLDYRTIHQIFDDNTAKHPDKECIVFYDVNQHRSCLTYEQLKDQSIKFAASLLKLGFKRGDRILLYSPNSLELIVCWMAMTRLGVCTVLMCPGDVDWQDVILLKRLKCNGLICGFEGTTEEQRQRIVGEIGEKIEQKNEHGQAYAKVIITIGEIVKTNIKHPNILQYENLMDAVSSDQPDVKLAERKVDADDSAFVCFTSGSNGKAKAVVYTHHAAVNAVNISLPGMGINGDRKSFSGRPISGGNGASAVILSLVVGCTYITTVLTKLTMKDSYKILFDINTAENSHCCSVPQEHVQQLLAENFQDKHDFSKVAAWGFGSQIVPRKTIKALLEAFPKKRAILVYAMNEVLTVGIQPLTHATIDKKEDYGKMYMFPDIEVKVIDDEGQVVPLGTKGEICVRGPKMFLEYLEDPAATSAAKKPTGWVHTSDYGIMYDRARIKVLGRQIDLIATKDKAFFPVEVEEVLLENPDVQDVVVVGVPNKDQKDDVCACIIEVPGSNLEVRVSELEKWCDNEFVANNNVSSLRPKHFLFMKEFPISDAAKINRKEIRKYAQKNCKLYKSK